jgi:LysR family transcriptional activator of nhaA
MSWLNYHHLYYFWNVIKAGSFTKAAEELNVAQSAVSSQIKSLEENLGQKLIVRNKSQELKLTEAGHFVFNQASEIFRLGHDLLTQAQNLNHITEVKVGVVGGLSKNFQLKLFEKIIEDERLRINVDVGDSQSLLTKLKNFEIDMILTDITYSRNEEENLLQKQVASEPFCLVSRRKITKSSSVKDFLDSGVFLPSEHSPVTVELTEFLRNENVNLKIKGYIDDIALLRLLAIETDALVAIPKVGAERELEQKELHLIYEFRKLKQNYYCVFRGSSIKTRAILSKLSI